MASAALPVLGSHREDHVSPLTERSSYTEAGHHEEGEAAEDGNPGASEDVILARHAHQWVHAVLVSCHPHGLRKQGQA